MPDTTAPPSTLALLRRARAIVAPHRSRVVLVTTLALVVAALGAAEPLVLKRIFDVLSGAAARAGLAEAVVTLVLLEVARAIFSGWLSVATWDVRLEVDYALRERVVGKLFTLPLRYHQATSVGAIMNRVNQSVQGALTAVAELAFNVAPALLYLVLAVLAMLRLDWRLALIVLVFTPVPALIGAWAAREQTVRERLLLERWTTLYSRMNEVLAGIRMVKAFAMEEVERRRFLSGQREGNRIVARGVRTDTYSGALRGGAATLARLVAIAVGAWLVARGELTVGTLVAFLGYIGGLFGPVQGLTNIYQTLQKGTVALEVIDEILDTPDEVGDLPGALDVAHVRGEVEFDHVTFGYDAATPVLRDVTLHVAPGETVAIVGPSGSGKTSLMLLLQRMFPIQSGRVLVDGHDVRSLTQRSLRANIGIVYQDVDLLADSIRGNIAYARMTASDEEVEAAARAAAAHDFIMEIPEGYDATVGEKGSRLSGGQRQRIGIARALLKDPPILVFDEATSALDSQSEAAIQQAIRRLTKDRTTFLIAHRLSTIMDADRIVVVRNGGVEAVGTHEELLRRSAWYADVVRRQQAGLPSFV